MTDQPKVDGSGAGENQSPVSKQPVDGAEQLSGLVRSVVKEVMAEELKPIKGDISGLYSRQDKDRNANREFMDEYRRQVANGLSDKDAESAAHNALSQREAQAEEKRMLAEVYERVVGKSSAQPAGNGDNGADARARLVAEAQVDPNSPEILRLLMDEKDPVRFAMRLGEIKGRMGKQAPDPANAASLQSQAANTGAPDVGKLTTEYQNKMAAAAGKPSEVRALKEEYRKKGVPVDQVVFH